MVKKLILMIILSITLFLSSCSLLDPDKILKEGYDNLILEQTVVARDFELPQSVSTSFFWPINVDWESSSSLITIDDDIAKVNFISNKEKDTDVELLAKISFSNKSITKAFTVTIPKYDLDKLTSNKTNFGNRLDIDGPLTEGCLPSTGNPKVLVIPVNLDSDNKTDKLLNDIEIAFNGSSEETGYESVKTYYQKSSYGKLNIEFNVMKEWFTPKRNKRFYEYYYDDDTYADGSTKILQEALAYFDNKINYSDYDLNNDDYIDSVWLIYNCDVDFEAESIYWAYTFWDYSDNVYDGKYACYYAFAGTDFMDPNVNIDESYDPKGITIDSHTYIHETGHLLGLEDYYDYDESKGATGGLYGADMMDCNIGDHGVISKLLLGWVEPTIIAGPGSITLDLNAFSTTGDCIIVADRKLTSIYDSYYIIELYNNEGLNSFVKPIEGYGIRITKINAEKNLVGGTLELNDGDYTCGFKYDNSDEKQLFVDLIYTGEVKYNGYSLDNNILFTEKEILNNNEIFFELTVNKCNNQTANITIKIS